MAGYKRKYSSDNTTANYNKFKRKSFTRQNYTSQRQVVSRFAKPPSKVELKYDDGSQTGALLAAGSITLLSTIANGTSPSERIGNHVDFHDMEIVWSFQPNAGLGPTRSRMIVVYDKQANGGLPTVAEVMRTTDPMSLFNPTNRSRFTPLLDTGVVSTAYNAGTGISLTNYGKANGSAKISLKGKRCLFRGTGSVISDIDSGSILLVLLTQDVGVSFTEHNRIQYCD